MALLGLLQLEDSSKGLDALFSKKQTPKDLANGHNEWLDYIALQAAITQQSAHASSGIWLTKGTQDQLLGKCSTPSANV